MRIKKYRMKNIMSYEKTANKVIIGDARAARFIAALNVDNKVTGASLTNHIYLRTGSVEHKHII